MSLTAASPTPTSPAALTSTWTLPKTIPELDGIRGLAILLVLLCHAGGFFDWKPLKAAFGYGSVGVDLFFVLGFLITGILIETRDDRNRTRNFYIRRGLRIWPLYFAFLMIAAIGFRRMMPAQPHFWACALFIQNFLCLEGAGPVLQPTWSLAVEEQFYIVWPWLAFRLKPESILRLCCVLVAVSPLIRLAHLYVGASGFYVYSNTLTRLDSIAVGAAIAAWVRTRNLDVERMKLLSKRAIAWCGSGAAIALYFGERHWASESLKYSLIALANRLGLTG